MADSLNPFDDTGIPDAEENENNAQIALNIPQIVSPPLANKGETMEISWDGIAAKLLRDNYILTALELYTEFIESGRELPRLRDYFSNPGNFERTKEDTPSPTLPRTSSVQTFDSLDFARYSDDGERQVDERVAVLEFELRKAQETIKSLRATLTQQAENELASPETQKSGGMGLTEGELLTPLERKALNFLVNEYLLQADYKVTSVTFAEENEEQDFEDWDDVGLNIARPPGLVHLFHDYSSHVVPNADTCEIGIQTDLEDFELQQLEMQWKSHVEELESKVMTLEDQVRAVSQENEVLNQQVEILKIGGRHPSSRMRASSSPPIHSLSTNPSTTLPSQSQSRSEYSSHSTQPSSQAVNKSGLVASTVERKLSGTSVRVPSPQPISTEAKKSQSDTVANAEVNKPEANDRIGSDSVDAALSIGERGQCEGQEEVGDLPHPIVTSEVEVEDRSSPSENEPESPSDLNFGNDNRKMASSFRKALLDIAFHVSRDNHIVSEMSQLGQSDQEAVVKMLARCLPHIVPNVLLAKREELIPVILCTAMLHPEARQRDQLLNILFNLIKKPDDDQRQMILTGCVVFAEHTGADRLVEELLPQCWEQIGHKYVERRLLVAEACGALASYLPAEIRSSLVLSMLQQMLSEDRDEEVREAVVKSLGLLMGFICDTDKYTQGYDLLMTALKDPKEKVHRAALHVFLPALGMWSRELGRLEHHLVHQLLHQLEDTVKGATAAQKTSNSISLPLNEARFLLLLSTLEELVPLLFLTVIETCPEGHKYTEEEVYVDMSRFPSASSALNDLSVMAGGEQNLMFLVRQFEGHIGEEWFEPWDEMNWIVNNLIPRLLEVTMTVGLTMQKVVHALCQFVFKICRTFGRTFTEKKVRWKFEELIEVPDEDFDAQVNGGHLAITTCIVPVYASGVLMSFVTDEDKSRLNAFLKQVLCTLAFSQSSLDSMRAALVELSINPSNHELLLSVLWDGVVHSSALVRAAAATLFELMIKGVSDVLVSSRVVPALVTLSNDQDIPVRVAVISSLGAVIENISIREVLDRVYMQLSMFFDDPTYRDQHDVHVELIRTLARCGPSAEPKFRDEFVLPRLAAIALANNQMTNVTKRTDIAMQLFEAYSAISCCSLSEQLIGEAMLPGLRCLKVDMEAIEADHQEVVNAMIKDYQHRLEAKSPTSGSTDDIKATVMSKINTTSISNLGNIFTRKK